MENQFDRRERTVYVSGMDEKVTEEHIYDVFRKAGPVEKVILKENGDGTPQHALVVFKLVESVLYCIGMLNGSTLYEAQINVRPLRESSHTAVLENAMAAGSFTQQTATATAGAPPQAARGYATPQRAYPQRLATGYEQQQTADYMSGGGGGGGAHEQRRYGPVGASLFGAGLGMPAAYNRGTQETFHRYPTRSNIARQQQQQTYGPWDAHYAQAYKMSGDTGLYCDQDERERTLYVGGLHSDVTKEIIHELFIQAGPVERVAWVDRRTEGEGGGGGGTAFAFVVFEHGESVPFAITVLSGVQLFRRALVIQPRDGSYQAQQFKQALRRAGRAAPSAAAIAPPVRILPPVVGTPPTPHGGRWEAPPRRTFPSKGDRWRADEARRRPRYDERTPQPAPPSRHRRWDY